MLNGHMKIPAEFKNGPAGTTLRVLKSLTSKKLVNTNLLMIKVRISKLGMLNCLIKTSFKMSILGHL